MKVKEIEHDYIQYSHLANELDDVDKEGLIVIEENLCDTIVKFSIAVEYMLNEYCIFLREKYPSFHYIIFMDPFELFYYHVFAEIEQCSS